MPCTSPDLWILLTPVFEPHFLMGSEENAKMKRGGGSWPLECGYPHPKMVSLLAGIAFSFIPGDSQPQLGVRMGRGILLPPRKAEDRPLLHRLSWSQTPSQTSLPPLPSPSVQKDLQKDHSDYFLALRSPKNNKKSTKIIVTGHFRVLVMATSRLCLMKDREGSQGLNPAWNCFVWNNEVSPECGYRKNPTKTWCGCAIKKTPIISISRAEFLQTLPLIPSDQPDKESAWRSRARTWRTLAIRTQGKVKILPPTFQLFPCGVSPPTSLDPTCLSTGICW